MIIQAIFIGIVIYLFFIIAYVTQNKSFENLNIKRAIDKNKVMIGEEFVITTVVENNKKMPIPLLVVKEKIPSEIEYLNNHANEVEEQWKYYTNRYSMWSFERRIRNYKVKCNKRGVYIINNIDLSIGDIFGFSISKKNIDDFKEIVVLPKPRDIENYKFKSNSYHGDNIIKRWIHKDPLYIRGIREYSVEDSMRDIHWASTMKNNKLMVKEYDFTSEKELTIIVNVEQKSNVWDARYNENIEDSIKLAVSLASKFIRNGIATGIWTNSKLMGLEDNFKKEVYPSINSFKSILEICARITGFVDKSFYESLKERLLRFKNNCTYIIITDNIDVETAELLGSLIGKNMDIKIIDVSENLNVPIINGIEKIEYRGEM